MRLYTSPEAPLGRLPAMAPPRPVSLPHPGQALLAGGSELYRLDMVVDMQNHSFSSADPLHPPGASAANILKIGSLASLLGVSALILAHWIYLTGKLDAPGGRAIYALGDLLYGPVLAPSLIAAVYALREHFGPRAPRRMSLALLAAALAAAAFVIVACIRAANRQYHLAHPELRLESSATVLLVWGTLLSGITAGAWHFLGWALLLIASAGWTSGRLSPLLAILYLAGGLGALFVFLFPELEGFAILLALLWGVWQGIHLWKAALTSA